MTDEHTPQNPTQARVDFERLVPTLRPKLHRYCARMTGSSVDGEDVVQEALAKAFVALDAATDIENVEAWMFRIAHNAALDFLRRRRRERDLPDVDDVLADSPEDEHARAQESAAALTTFMRLAARQRSCVILKDVLGYSIEEIGRLIDTSDMAVKAALHRGRARLRELSAEHEAPPPLSMESAERARLQAYIERFNARDFEALRTLLAEDVRLDLVGRLALNGKAEVGNYFSNYARASQWRMSLGYADGRAAVLVSDSGQRGAAAEYFVLLDWFDGEISTIRDFRYAGYVAETAVMVADTRVPN